MASKSDMKVESYKDGSRLVFHRRGLQAWNHKPGEKGIDKATGETIPCLCTSNKT